VLILEWDEEATLDGSWVGRNTGLRAGFDDALARARVDRDDWSAGSARQQLGASVTGAGRTPPHAVGEYDGGTFADIPQSERGMGRLDDPTTAGSGCQIHATGRDPRELDAAATGTQGGVAFQIRDHDGAEIGGCRYGRPYVPKLNAPGVRGRSQWRDEIRTADGPDRVMDCHARPRRDGDAQVELHSRD
jgi:hypothetical protein